jgi:hypothetical protein
MIAFVMMGLLSVLGFLCLSSGIATATAPRRTRSDYKR